MEIYSEHLHSQTIRAREMKFRDKVHLPPLVICHISHVICHMSYGYRRKGQDFLGLAGPDKTSTIWELLTVVSLYGDIIPRFNFGYEKFLIRSVDGYNVPLIQFHIT